MDSEVKINLNLCSTEQLHSFVPQLSFDLAHKIVSYRRRKGPFESLESLLDIRGINRKLFTNLRQRVFVADEGNTFGPNDRQCRGERNRKMRRRQTISSSRSRREFKGRLGEKLYLHPVKRKENRKQKRCQFPPNDVTRIDQEGLLIFLKGDLKEYSRVLDGIQITVSPKQKSVTGNSWSSSFTCNDQHNTSGSSNPRDQVKTPESCEPRPTEEPSNAIINKTPKETQESPLTRNGTLFDSFTSNEQTSLIEKSTRLCPSRTAGVRSLAVANKHQETQTEDYKRHEESEEDEEQEPSKNERVRSWLSETQDSPPFFSDQRVGLQTEYESMYYHGWFYTNISIDLTALCYMRYGAHNPSYLRFIQSTNLILA